jgi:hypothetical protein
VSRQSIEFDSGQKLKKPAGYDSLPSVFATFGIVVAWADFYSRGYPKPINEEPAAAKDGHRNLPDERRAA